MRERKLRQRGGVSLHRRAPEKSKVYLDIIVVRKVYLETIKVWVSEKCSKKYSKKHSKKFYLLKKGLMRYNTKTHTGENPNKFNECNYSSIT